MEHEKRRNGKTKRDREMADILTFGLNNEKQLALCTVAKKIGVNVTDVARKDYGQKIGALAGIQGFSKERKSFDGPDFAAEMIVFSGMNPQQVDMFLAEYKATGEQPIALKAIITPYNVSWTADALFRELMKEHFQLGR